MLDKMKVILIAGLLFQVLKAFVPSLDFSEGFDGAVEALINSIYVIVPVVVGWFTKESQKQVNKLVTR